MIIRVLIADDNDAFRSVIADIVRGEGWAVCGSAADGEAAIEMAGELRPDVVVLDFQMPRRDGISAGRCIHALLPDVPVFVYTSFASPYLEAEAKGLGLRGVIQKGDIGALTSAIHNALSAAPRPN